MPIIKRPHERSKHFNIFLVALAVLAAGAVIFAYADGYARPHRVHGWAASGHGEGIARFCADDRGGALDAALVYGAHALDVGDAQQAPWDAFAEALRAASDSLEGVCADAAAAPATAPEGLALAEAALAAGTEAVRDFRPAFDALYAALDADQRASLDDLLARHTDH